MTKSWNGYLRPTSQLSNPISLPGDRKKLVCGSLTLSSLLNGFVERSRLSCPGIPGTGKTMVAAIMIDHLLRAKQSNTIKAICILCNYKTHADQNTISLLAAILNQLVQARPSITEPIAHLHDNYTNRKTGPSLEEIFRVLKFVLNHYSSVYVIDALDECPDKDGTQSQFLAKLRDLQCKTDLCLMVTSRFITDIVVEFRLIPIDRKSTRLNSSHPSISRMPSSA